MDTWILLNSSKQRNKHYKFLPLVSSLPTKN